MIAQEVHAVMSECFPTKSGNFLQEACVLYITFLVL